LFYWEVNEDEVGIERKNGGWIEGMEDIRIFQRENTPTLKGVTRLDFIATSLNYSNSNNNRMVIGNYEIDENAGRCLLKNCRVLSTPYENSGCEKNWIPIEKEKNTPDNDEKIKEYFIYKWSPLEIISLTNSIESHNKWTIDTVETNSPGCKKFRGSTVFINTGGNDFLGIFHFTEGCGGNKCYFHCFVTINKKTMKPERYSQPFYFEKKGIEYCIGFYIQPKEVINNCENINNNYNTFYNKFKYYFWISQMDKEPLMIVTDVPNLKWFLLNTVC